MKYSLRFFEKEYHFEVNFKTYPVNPVNPVKKNPNLELLEKEDEITGC